MKYILPHEMSMGLRAADLLNALEKFSTLFGLRLCQQLFSASKQTSRTLQAKDLNIHEAMDAIAILHSYYQRLLESECFQAFFERIQTEAQSLKIGDPTLPRYGRPPARLEKENPQKFTLPVDYYRKHVQLWMNNCKLDLIKRIWDPY